MLLAPFALLAASCASDFVMIDAAWFACERDAECTILQDVTCTLTPVNRRYEDELAVWRARRSDGRTRDGACPASPVRYVAECDDSRCSSRAVPPER